MEITKENFKKWLVDAVNDSFMDLFFYDRKNCEEMPIELLAEFEKEGIITKKLLKEVFMRQIDNEFIEKPLSETRL